MAITATTTIKYFHSGVQNFIQHLDSDTVPMLSVSTLLNDWMYNFR